MTDERTERILNSGALNSPEALEAFKFIQWHEYLSGVTFGIGVIVFVLGIIWLIEKGTR